MLMLGGKPTFRIGEKVAVGYLELEGTTNVSAGTLKWSKAKIMSGPTVTGKKKEARSVHGDPS